MLGSQQLAFACDDLPCGSLYVFDSGFLQTKPASPLTFFNSMCRFCFLFFLSGCALI